jgi:hypothetical protein
VSARSLTEPLFEVADHLWQGRQCPVCGCSMSLTFSHTYVVQRQDWVKIGATNNPRRRLSELSRPTWSKHLLSPDGMDWEAPLVALVIVEEDLEHRLHRMVRHLHVVGEWFHPGDDLWEWVTHGL